MAHIAVTTEYPAVRSSSLLGLELGWVRSMYIITIRRNCSSVLFYVTLHHTTQEEGQVLVWQCEQVGNDFHGMCI